MFNPRQYGIAPLVAIRHHQEDLQCNESTSNLRRPVFPPKVAPTKPKSNRLSSSRPVGSIRPSDGKQNKFKKYITTLLTFSWQGRTGVYEHPEIPNFQTLMPMHHVTILPGLLVIWSQFLAQIIYLLNALDPIDVTSYNNSLLLHLPTMTKIDGLKTNRGSNLDILEMITSALPLLVPKLMLFRRKA